MTEPKTRICRSCDIRHAVCNMIKVGNCWYCEKCAPAPCTSQKGISVVDIAGKE